MLCPDFRLPLGVDGHQRAKDVDKMILTDPSETRTKESNIYASVKVQNLWTRNESKGPLALGWTPFRGAHSTDLDIF